MKTTYNEQLPLSEIKTWSYQRQQINEAKLTEQKADIQKRGVIEPILVRKTKNGIEGIAGFLRFKASEQLGLKTIPSRVYTDIDDLTAHELLAVENFQRQELSDIDTANILSIFVVEHKLSQKEIAEKLNMSEPYVSLYLSLLKDKEPLRKAISESKVTEKQARLIRALPTDQAMTEALEAIQNAETEKHKTDEKANVTVQETKEIVTKTLGKYTKEQLDAEIKTYTDKILEIASFKLKRDGLQQQIDQIGGELKALKTDNQDINRNIKKIMELEQKYFPAKEEITTLRSQIADLNKTRPTNPQQHIAQLENERKKVYENQARTKTQIDTLTEQIKTLRNEHKKMQENASVLTQQMSQLKAVETQIATATQNLKKAEDLVNSYQESHKTAIDNFEAIKAKVEAEDRTLLDKRKELADKIANLSHEKLQLNGKIANEKNYQEAISTLQKKQKNLQ